MIYIAKKAKTTLAVGMPEIENGKYYNTSVVIGARGYVAKHQKTHLFYKESKFFEKGKTKPTLFELGKYKIGLGVCYDYMFPEFWRFLALKGADLFVNTANYKYDYGLRLMQTRAIENGVVTINTNRIGTERGLTFRGGSIIVNARGKILKQASTNKTEIFVVDVDLNQSRNKKWNPYNDLFKDRRPDMYRD